MTPAEAGTSTNVCTGSPAFTERIVSVELLLVAIPAKNLEAIGEDEDDDANTSFEENLYADSEDVGGDRE